MAARHHRRPQRRRRRPLPALRAGGGAHLLRLRRDGADPPGLPAARPGHPAGHQRVEPAGRPGDLHPRAATWAGRGRQVDRRGRRRPPGPGAAAGRGRPLRGGRRQRRRLGPGGPRAGLLHDPAGPGHHAGRGLRAAVDEQHGRDRALLRAPRGDEPAHHLRRGAAGERRVVRPGDRAGAAVHAGGADRGAVGPAGDGDRPVDRAAARARLGASAPDRDQDRVRRPGVASGPGAVSRPRAGRGNRPWRPATTGSG
ncbi:hypothetical protein [Ornithinimicrobium kibberense]|uniref:hypothetical protein n=1 Tax=Ornithinimicrobium kibberense TaxID=282060 RepID=UPI003622CEB4